MKPKKRKITYFIVNALPILLLFSFFVYVSFSPYATPLAYNILSIPVQLNGYEALLNNISNNCLNLSNKEQSYCIHYEIGQYTGFKYSDCKGEISSLKELGGCCRDWALLLAKVYSYFGWKYQYISYTPELLHMRIDVYKNNTYCVIDMGEIACVGGNQYGH